MPPPKKAAKKAAKKPAKHHDPKHHETKDLRRAYEHLGRVELLQNAGQVDADVSVLATLAQKELKAGHVKEAADLLRAAEHLSFAALGSERSKSSAVAADLKATITEEFDHLLERAEEHWAQGNEGDRHAAVVSLYKRVCKRAKKALDEKSYRPALELAHAAEALAHVRKHGADQLPSGKEHLKLGRS